MSLVLTYPGGSGKPNEENAPIGRFFVRLDQADSLVVLEPLSFPWESLSARQWSVPMVIDFRSLDQAGAAAMESIRCRLTPFDAVVIDSDPPATFDLFASHQVVFGDPDEAGDPPSIADKAEYLLVHDLLAQLLRQLPRGDDRFGPRRLVQTSGMPRINAKRLPPPWRAEDSDSQHKLQADPDVVLVTLGSGQDTWRRDWESAVHAASSSQCSALAIGASLVGSAAGPSLGELTVHLPTHAQLVTLASAPKLHTAGSALGGAVFDLRVAR